ncbi:class I mannose-6-phosphate isomerase [soil metagenome]
MSELYPLKFKTIFKDKIWGGQKIREILGKDFSPLSNCGETWELSGVKDNVSIVEGGTLDGIALPDLIDQYKGSLVGEKIYSRFGNEFPLLIKFIDANQDLSIQVHPGDDLAKSRHNSFGKTEMWYIIQADVGAKLISGFNQAVTKEEYLKQFNNGFLMQILNEEPVNADDVFFIPAGRVHTIGKGLLLAEIQQTSDITYRIFDFDRVDEQGKKRELHVEEAMEAIDFNYYQNYKTPYPKLENEPVKLVNCHYFITNLLNYTEDTIRNYKSLDSFVIFICLDGHCSLTHKDLIIQINKGETLLLPASIDFIKLETTSGYKLLEVYID